MCVVQYTVSCLYCFGAQVLSPSPPLPLPLPFPPLPSPPLPSPPLPSPPLPSPPVIPPYIPSVASPDDTTNFEVFEPKKEDRYLDIPSRNMSGFSGKQLPFVGFTFTRYDSAHLDVPDGLVHACMKCLSITHTCTTVLWRLLVLLPGSTS